MNSPTDQPGASSTAQEQAESRLARLGVQVEAMQAVLVRLLQDVVRAELRLERSDVGQLREANERLVVAALNLQAEVQEANASLAEGRSVAAQDALTLLPNRRALSERFAQAKAHARRSGTRVAVLFVDLDNFKQLNDTHGHAFGDAVLQLVAARMSAAMREVDTVCRHGGDEFLILLADLNEPDDAVAVAGKLLGAIGAVADIQGRQVSVTASIGIAVHRDDGEDLDTLVAHADKAMYQAKAHHGGGIAVYGQPAVATSGGVADVAPPPRPAGAAAHADDRLAQLREANEHLVVAAITAQELKEAAEAARQRQVEFLSAVADELRNPAAPIRIATAMLGREPPDEPLLPRVKDIVDRQVAHVASVVDRLVDASIVGSGAVELQLRTMDLSQLVQRVADGLRALTCERDQTLQVDLPASDAQVDGDEARLEQVVGNLLENASRHTHAGGSIRVTLEVLAESLRLTVVDNGIGITPRMLPHVFEPFVQDTHAFGLDGVGVGIGLTVAQALARAHGGTLTASSDGVGQGSRFVLTLARARAGGSGPLPGATSTEPKAGDT